MFRASFYCINLLLNGEQIARHKSLLTVLFSHSIPRVIIMWAAIYRARSHPLLNAIFHHNIHNKMIFKPFKVTQ